MKKKFTFLLVFFITISIGFSGAYNAAIKKNQAIEDNNITRKMGKEFFIRNREKLAQRLENNSMVVLFSNHSMTDRKHYPNSNLYYFTGIDEGYSIFVMKKIDNKLEEILFIKSPKSTKSRWTSDSLNEKEAKEISGIEDIRGTTSFSTDVNNIKSIYLDVNIWDKDRFIENLRLKDDKPYILKEAKEEFALDILDNHSNINIKSIKDKVSELRAIKTGEEIEKIKKAINITKEGIKELMKNAKPNMMEYELQSYFDFTAARMGSTEHSFLPIAASGKNATILHYDANNSKIKDGDLILFDVGADYHHYASDISRTFPVNGKFTERQKQIYNIVLKAQKETIKAVKPGITILDLDDITKKILFEECKKIGLLETKEELGEYYFHSVSHPMGLDVHDLGMFSELKPGMVITIEPGLYIEEEGIGIRIEDDILITEDGYENLSKNIIKEIDDIEEFMNK